MRWQWKSSVRHYAQSMLTSELIYQVHYFLPLPTEGVLAVEIPYIRHFAQNMMYTEFATHCIISSATAVRGRLVGGGSRLLIVV